MELNYQVLKARQREIRGRFPDGLGLRVHRALSWLNRAEQEPDPDSRFIFLWIAFNAAYAFDDREREGFSERGRFNQFLGKLVDLDAERRLYNLVWDAFPKSIRLLINNRYVYQPFWDYQSGLIKEDAWQSKFELGKAIAHRALGSMDTARVLSIVFDRLYVLRNQLIHGGATWNSTLNRDQVRDGSDIIGRVTPVVIHLMMERHGALWGEPSYPVVE